MKSKWEIWKENWLKTQKHLEYERNMKKLFIIVLIISIILVLIVGIIYLRRLKNKKNLDEKKPLFKNEGNNEEVI
jgi:flagellar basal body-associated protein FliL